MTDDSALRKITKGIVDNYLKKNKDYISIIAGKEGIGKTNLAFCLSDHTADIAGTSYWVDNICFNPQETRNTADDLDKMSPLHIDEGANVFNKYESMSAEVRSTIKKVTMMREYNLHTIICISNPNDLHTYFKEHRLDADGISLFRVVHRGVAWWLGNSATSMISRKLKKNKFSWSDLDNKVKRNIRRLRFPNYEEQHPEFAEKYHEKKTRSVAEVDTEEEDEITKADIMRKIYEFNPDAKTKTVARLLDTNPNYVSQVKSMKLAD